MFRNSSFRYRKVVSREDDRKQRQKHIHWQFRSICALLTFTFLLIQCPKKYQSSFCRLNLYKIWRRWEREIDNFVNIHCFHLQQQVIHRFALHFWWRKLFKLVIEHSRWIQPILNEDNNIRWITKLNCAMETTEHVRGSQSLTKGNIQLQYLNRKYGSTNVK